MRLHDVLYSGKKFLRKCSIIDNASGKSFLHIGMFSNYMFDRSADGHHLSLKITMYLNIVIKITLCSYSIFVKKFDELITPPRCSCFIAWIDELNRRIMASGESIFPTD